MKSILDSIRLIMRNQQNLKNNTGYNKNQRIFNYQISDFVSQTKKTYCITVPWNTVFISKIFDSFTRYESTENYIDEVKIPFRNHIYNLYKYLTDDYNELARAYHNKIENCLK